jgi:hypothetical protein
MLKLILGRVAMLPRNHIIRNLVQLFVQYSYAYSAVPVYRHLVFEVPVPAQSAVPALVMRTLFQTSKYGICSFTVYGWRMYVWLGPQYAIINIFWVQFVIGRLSRESCVTKYTEGWVDIGTRTKVPLKFVTYLSKITKINEKSVLTQWPLHHFGSCTI